MIPMRIISQMCKISKKLFHVSYSKQASYKKNVMRYAVSFSTSSQKPAVVLGIESSCDDTGIGIVDSNGNILGEALYSQQLEHLRNGGVIPFLAQDLHRAHITDVCETALRAANLRLRDVDAIATTVKPGLPLSLKVGILFGKYLSKKGNKPFIPIHHMHAHALTVRLVEKVEFPYLVLLISGGHSLLAIVENVDKFYELGGTFDDAPGEALDKIARRLKLTNIPDFSKVSGGEAIEIAASRADDPTQFKFELPLLHNRDCNFSFSGLKNNMTILIQQKEKEHGIAGDTVLPEVYNLCAAFQLTVTQHLCHRVQRAMEFIDKKDLFPKDKRVLVVSGGVACNNFIAEALNVTSAEQEFKFVRTPPKFCRDNGVMIAWNGIEKWLASSGILRDKAEIEKVDFEKKAPLGENWREKVTSERIKISRSAVKIQAKKI